MSTRAHYFKIGVFVISALTLGVLGVIVFGAGTVFREKIMAESYFDGSVQGLDIGSPVKYRGVQIGTVDDITLVANQYDTDPDEYFQYRRYVLVKIALYPDVFKFGRIEDLEVGLENAIAAGLTVRLALQGLTGAAYLEADFVDPERFPPPKIAWEPKTIYIPSAPSTITQLTQSVEEVLRKLTKTDIEGVAVGIEEFLDVLTKEVKDLQVATIREEVHQSLAGFRKTAETLNKVAARLDSVLEGGDVQRTLKNVAQASEKLTVASEDLPETVALLKRTFRRLDSLVSSQREDIEVAIRDIRLISESVKELIDNAKRYPSHLLFGEPPPRLELENRK